MNCPYCLTPLDKSAYACKACARDVFLFKPLLEKIEQLEDEQKKLSEIPFLKSQIDALQSELDAMRDAHEKKEKQFLNTSLNVFKFVFLPLILLLISHAVITVVYDFNLLYLRIVSIVVPLPFGYYLFRSCKRAIFPWIASSGVLAALSVIGMSAITAHVDGTPVMPQSMIEWREFIEYSASITFSFLTGMLIGGLAYNKATQPKSTSEKGDLLVTVIATIKDGNLSPEAIGKLIKKIEDLGGSVAAAGTTAMSAYTGLKAVL